jgi:hypothetical protein
VLLQAGHRHRPRHRAERDDQLVVLELAFVALRGRDEHLLAVGVGAGDAPEQQIGPLHVLAQGHDHVPRLERAGAGAGQQRRVEHEVHVGDDGHLRGMRRERALELARRV